MLAGCAKPRTDVNSTVFLWTAKYDNIMVLTWTQKEFAKEFFRFRKKIRLYSKDNSVRLVVWR